MTTHIIAPGIYYDIAAADYFADPLPKPSLTQTIAKLLIEKSPAHARLEHPRLMTLGALTGAYGVVEIAGDTPEKYDAAKAIGNAAHAIMIGRGKSLKILAFDNFQTKAAKEARDAARAAGEEPILEKHIVAATNMVKAAREQLAATEHAEAFTVGDGEVVLAWQEGDLWLRSMVDWMVDPTRIYDFKTSGMSCAPHIVAERPSTDGWDIQAAMIERGLDVLDPVGAGRRSFVFVAQENTPPYALVPVRISEHDLTMGRKKLAYAVEVWSRCMASGQWPAYPIDTVLSRPRGYTETKWLERETEHAERKPPMLTSLAGG